MGSLTRGLLLGWLIASLVLALLPAMAHGETSQPVPVYQTLEELAGMRFAYVNGSVYNLNVRKRLEGTTEEFYPSLAECVAAVEAGIFEHPQRQETHDFIFRVRSWEWDIDSLTPDLLAMEAYCQRQFMGRRAANACELMVDEIISNQLLNVARSRGIANPATHVTFTAGEGGVDMVMTVDYRGVMRDGSSPDQGDWDVLSKAIVESYCDHWEMLEPGIVRLYIHQ